MMKPAVILAVVALSAAALTGCGKDADFALESKMTAMEKSMKEQKAALAAQGLKIAALEKQNAELQKAAAGDGFRVAVMEILRNSEILSDLLLNVKRFETLADAFEGATIPDLLKNVREFKKLADGFRGKSVESIFREMAASRKFRVDFSGIMPVLLKEMPSLLENVKNNKVGVAGLSKQMKSISTGLGKLTTQMNQIDKLVKTLSGKLIPIR